jgi:hypothetical protein
MPKKKRLEVAFPGLSALYIRPHREASETEEAGGVGQGVHSAQERESASLRPEPARRTNPG